MDAEKLLRKVLAGAVQGSSGKKKKKKKHKRSDDLMGGVLGGLASGKGLITAIGLGVGAYEILRKKSPPAVGHTPAPPPGSNSFSAGPPVGAAVPPPIPRSSPVQAASDPAAGTAGRPLSPAEEESGGAEQELALRLIQTMVAAAHADGSMDSGEEQRILAQLQQQGLDQEEKLFLLAQLHHPRTIDELVAGVDEPQVAQAMYSLAASTIVVDTPAERQWLDQLAAALSLSANIQHFIEQEL